MITFPFRYYFYNYICIYTRLFLFFVISNKSNNFFHGSLFFFDSSTIKKKRKEFITDGIRREILFLSVFVLTSYQQRYEHGVGEKGGEVDDFSNGLNAAHQTQEADYPSEGQTS